MSAVRTLPADLYEAVTQRIIAVLEQGTAPWVRPWSQGLDTVPVNASSHRPYRGVNSLLLSLEAANRGYPLNRWLTYRQACELGGQVRRGETGTTVIFWKLRNVNATANAFPTPDESNADDRVIPLLRSFTVFNLAQVDGVPAALQDVVRHDWAPQERAEELIRGSGATVRSGGAQAFYSPSQDEIRLPPRQWFGAGGHFYATALHELVHWTAHPSRCNRQLGKRFGDAAYACEELIAEMGSAFLCAYCRIDGQLQHEAYLQSWLEVLRRDKRAIFVAATAAQAASDFLINLVAPAVGAALAA